MLPNAFIGKTEQPKTAELNAALGETRILWEQLVAAMTTEMGIGAGEWHSYSSKAGWSLRMRKGKRNIVYLVPHAGGFHAALVLGDRALAAMLGVKLPAAVLRIVEAATRYPEGTGFRLEVKTARDIQVVKQLVTIKLAN
jgi:hypothetical protein